MAPQSHHAVGEPSQQFEDEGNNPYVNQYLSIVKKVSSGLIDE